MQIFSLVQCQRLIFFGKYLLMPNMKSETLVCLLTKLISYDFELNLISFLRYLDCRQVEETERARIVKEKNEMQPFLDG